MAYFRNEFSYTCNFFLKRLRYFNSYFPKVSVIWETPGFFYKFLKSFLCISILTVPTYNINVIFFIWWVSSIVIFWDVSDTRLLQFPKFQLPQTISHFLTNFQNYSHQMLKCYVFVDFLTCRNVSVFRAPLQNENTIGPSSSTSGTLDSVEHPPALTHTHMRACVCATRLVSNGGTCERHNSTILTSGFAG